MVVSLLSPNVETHQRGLAQYCGDPRAGNRIFQGDAETKRFHRGFGGFIDAPVPDGEWQPSGVDADADGRAFIADRQLAGAFLDQIAGSDPGGLEGGGLRKHDGVRDRERSAAAAVELKFPLKPNAPGYRAAAGGGFYRVFRYCRR
jgi:hypothetical protein